MDGVAIFKTVRVVYEHRVHAVVMTEQFCAYVHGLFRVCYTCICVSCLIFVLLLGGLLRIK